MADFHKFPELREAMRPESAEAEQLAREFAALEWPVPASAGEERGGAIYPEHIAFVALWLGAIGLGLWRWMA
jgi:hypothetical protein